MIPVRLNPRNFMCYTDVHQPLVFDGIKTACISGSNGHGKSALLDAMTWALWGKARTNKADDLIHQGQNVTEMEVEFEFALGDEQYRVIRKRSKRTRVGQSMLELAIKDQVAEEYRPITGDSQSDTQRQIDQLLKMSYETFTSSSFILQGKADSFTTKAPAERKQILAEILDLSYYDQLEARAKSKVVELDQREALLRQQIAAAGLELQQKPDLVKQQGQLEGELAALEETLGELQERSRMLGERLARLLVGQQEQQDQERRLHETCARAERQRARKLEADEKIEGANKILEREAEIERGHAELVEKRSELERWTGLQSEHARLTQEAAGLERTIVLARGQLEGRRDQAAVQLAALQSDASAAERRRAEQQAAQAECDEVERLDEERARLEAQIAEELAHYREVETRHKQHLESLEEARRHSELLSSSPTCPVCQTELDGDRHQHVLGQYQQEQERARQASAKQEQEMQAVKRKGESLRADLEKLGSLADRRRAAQQRLAQSQAALSRLEEQARARDDLEAERRRVQVELEKAAYAAQEQRDLASLSRELADLAYDAEQHRATRAAVEERREFESLHQALDVARLNIEREQKTRAEAETELAELEAAGRTAQKRLAELQAELADLPSVESVSKQVEAELREQRLRQGRLNQELGAVRQRLNTMEFTQKLRDQRLLEQRGVLQERSLYSELVQAFGKKGIQAMLIETAIPELEDEANRLLNLITRGSMSVSFQTKRSGVAGGQIDTLDIVVRDELGPRPYELYSGGEAFRANFAIRVALSKLLAQRAGARLQTLVIDEGFGSQDDDGRERLVEAITAIQPEFEKILVITHLSDLKEAFPTHIEVTKTAAGSTFEVH